MTKCMVHIFLCVGRRDTCVCEGIAGRKASGRFLGVRDVYGAPSEFSPVYET